MNTFKNTFTLIGFIFLLSYEALSAIPVKETKLKVESGKMLFTLVKTSSSGYDPSMTEFASMTGVANDVSGTIDMQEKTFDVTMDVSLASFSLAGKFKFANNRMHETHLESSQFSTASFKGTIVSYDEKNGKTKVVGKMTAHGVTKENFTVEGKITPSASKKGYLFTAAFKVNLRDFNIEVPNTQLTKVSEIVKLKLKLELRKEK